MTDPHDDAPLRPPGPRPTAPTPEQCCGTACDPCIWTYHERAVARWERRLARWQAVHPGDGPDHHDG